ncbi:hypothetical protein [Streptobacillus canis]|uniref:hypothetical protein n=1 Tax=Streptobacillus canis TaxID=2678686 RepID=UPI0012E14499|nr:hypothetical protein [Streptobacillus canis]
MSYRIYLNVERDGVDIGDYQLFGNNDYPDSLYEYLISENLIDKEYLEDNEYCIDKIEIKNLKEFNEKVIVPNIKNDIHLRPTKNKYGTYYNVPISKDGVEKGTVYETWLMLKTSKILMFYNLCEFLNENDCFKNNFLKSLELKEDIKLYIEAF